MRGIHVDSQSQYQEQLGDISPSEEVLKHHKASFCGIVSSCSEMRSTFSLVEKVAPAKTTVLILGESGTGKELFAKAIHKKSRRKGKLVPVNCGAIPEDILESELFGHEKGAFTGAVASKIGRFQMAHTGTIFLDEIGEMSPKLQVKLLRVLQERKVDAVGSTRSVDVDVRVIAATNKDLRLMVEKGTFREDLYYRLAVVPVTIPPLRYRSNDILLLANYFLSKSCADLDRDSISLSEEAMEVILRYKWPGNVRELENMMERIAILTDRRTVASNDLPEHLHEQHSDLIPEKSDFPEVPMSELPEDGVDFNVVIDKFERHLIKLALEKTGWNKKAASDLLKLNRTTLVEKIRKKGILPNEEVL